MKRKILKVGIIAILLIWLYATIVNALSFSATMTPSSTSVDKSTEFTIRVFVSNLDVGSNGINTLSGKLTYDTDVFEQITDSSIDGLNSWSPSFNSTTGKITLTKTTFVKSEEAVFQVTFKTKSEISASSGTITFTNITASNSETEISASDISTTISIGSDNTNTANTTNTNTSNTLYVRNTIYNVVVPENNTTSNSAVFYNTIPAPTPSPHVYNNTVVNTSSEGDLPHSGVEDTVLYMIIALIAVAIVFYIKFERVNKEIR